MSLTTTWTARAVPARRSTSHPRPYGPRPAWDCDNCALLNPGTRRRCADCGTTRD